MDERALLTKAETHQVMIDYERRLGDVVVRAVGRWKSLPPGHAVSLTARTRASAIHDFIVEEATAEFLGDPCVTVSHKRGTVVLVFAGKVAIRFKKVQGTALRYSVGSTQRQRAIHDQQLALDGTDVRPTWATAGYRLDAAGELIQTALVVNSGDEQKYVLDLVTVEHAEVTPLPVAEDDDDDLVIRVPGTDAGTTRDRRGAP